jgi:PTH1 family peptidyl-tRNA hydrolase
MSLRDWVSRLFASRPVEIPGQPLDAEAADWERYAPVQLWVGLGNPGASYAMHRHNVGYMAADAIAELHGFDSAKKAFGGWTRQGRISGRKILLLKPATYMNESGRAVGEAMRFFRLAEGDVTVFHDELDLAPFKVKAKVGGGTAGHNGLRSVEQHIGNAFRRVRIGIGHPGHKDRVTAYVLGNYAKAERDPLADLLGAIAAEAAWLAKGDEARFMSEVAVRMQEPEA